MTEPCPVCGVDLSDDTEVWLHLREAHSAPTPRRTHPTTSATSSPTNPSAAPPNRAPGGAAEDGGGASAGARTAAGSGAAPGADTDGSADAGAAGTIRGGIWRQGYANGPATMVILAVTIAAWLADRGLHYGWGIELSHALGGNGKLYADGQWWRIVTPLVVHFGPLHLLFNLAWLYQLGPAVERLVGRVLLVATYVATGIAGNLCSDILHHNQQNLLSGGASGAVYGMGGVIVGAYVATRWRERRQGGPSPGAVVFNGPAVRSLAIFFGAYLVIGSLIPHIDGAAHFGGGVAGLAVGAVVGGRVRSRA